MRHAYKDLRQKFVDSLRQDLIGPYDMEEEIMESPTTSYIMGRLSPVNDNYTFLADKEVDFSEKKEESNEDDLTDELENDDTLYVSKNKQSSAGLKVFVANDVKHITALLKWADYRHNEVDEKHSFKRFQKEFPKEIDVSKSNVTGECIEKDIYLSWLVHKLDTGYKMISVYIENRRNQVKDNVEKHIFQVELEITSDEEVFVSENIAYGKQEEEDYFYNRKPIFSRGYGCAAVWKDVVGNCVKSIKTDFLPEKEINGMDADLEKFKDYFSMLEFSLPENKEIIIDKLQSILGDYALWISRLESHEYMKSEDYQSVGREKIDRCYMNLDRMIEGLELIQKDEESFQAFIFMNQAMHLSRSMANFSKSKDEEKCLEDYKTDHSFWRPFQIGFILLNIKGIVKPETSDREILDLLYFPTGGGKTEAYLGIIAFLMAYRRLTRKECEEYDKDGGVTVIVRYTLRLLTTQQRDRMLKLISACEMIRMSNPELFGNKEYSIGFWVGSSVTINQYKDLKVSEYNKQNQVEFKKKGLKAQILKCPCCGKDLDKKTSYDINVEDRFFKIYCASESCFFNRRSIPVYLIDEDIYSKTPTVIIGTVDKFARITFEERVSLLFGKRDTECSDCGSFLPTDIELIKECSYRGHLLEQKQKLAKPFYPPELILQDELHLITGPLGTIYGNYEMAVEELCKATVNGKVIKPKYIASTATIKNADSQIKALYARENYNQFPPSGHDAEDSYFARERDLETFPFRLYLGVSSPYTSMKTTILRVYAVLLQTAERYKEDPIYKDYIDTYWTLMGYYNSKRELGGAVRLIQDDIPDRTLVLQEKNKDKWARRYLNYDEITSRKESWQIPQVLENLEKEVFKDEYPLDIAVATNMIQVGMDVDRLGLMAVTGQPKTTAEYIQATSRIGRQTPGLVVTIYNPYRARDLSHYENFTAYHAHLYRFVEGTSATPFSSRARERALHASLIGMLRGMIDELRSTKVGARKIEQINQDDIQMIIDMILNRIKIVDPNSVEKAEDDIRYFLDEWIKLSRTEKNLYYNVHHNNQGYKMNRVQRLLKAYGSYGRFNYEKETLNSMRNVQKESGLYLWED